MKSRGLFLLAIILSANLFPVNTQAHHRDAGASFSVQVSFLEQPVVLEKVNIEAGVKTPARFSFAAIQVACREDSFVVSRKDCPVLVVRHYLRNPFYIIRRSNAP